MVLKIKGILAVLAGMWATLSVILSGKELNTFRLEHYLPQTFINVFILLGVVISTAFLAYAWRCFFLMMKGREE